MILKELLENVFVEDNPDFLIPLKTGKFSLKTHSLFFEKLLLSNLTPTVVEVDPSKLFATQRYVSDVDGEYGMKYPIFPDYSDKPIVVLIGSDMYLLDGHHRCTRAFIDGKQIEVYLFHPKISNIIDNP